MSHESSGLTPLGPRVLVHLPKTEEKTAGGIIIPELERNRQDQSQLSTTILSIGEYAFSDCHIKPKVGDKVSITKFAGYIYKGDDGEEYRIVRDEEIVAIHAVFDPQEKLKELRNE